MALSLIDMRHSGNCLRECYFYKADMSDSAGSSSQQSSPNMEVGLAIFKPLSVRQGPRLRIACYDCIDRQMKACYESETPSAQSPSLTLKYSAFILILPPPH